MHYKGLFDWKGGWKNERIENILISFLSVWLWVKKWKDGKSEFGKIYSDTIVKKWCPIKKKKWQTTKKHYSHPNLLKNKNHVLEKIMYKKKKKTLSHPSPRKKRKRQRRRRKRQRPMGKQKKKKKRENKMQTFFFSKNKKANIYYNWNWKKRKKKKVAHVQLAYGYFCHFLL